MSSPRRITLTHSSTSSRHALMPHRMLVVLSITTLITNRRNGRTPTRKERSRTSPVRHSMTATTSTLASTLMQMRMRMPTPRVVTRTCRCLKGSTRLSVSHSLRARVQQVLSTSDCDCIQKCITHTNMPLSDRIMNSM